MPVVDTTRTFTNNEQITSTKLNEIMDNSSFVSGAVVSNQGLEVTAGGQMQIPNGGIKTALLENSTSTSNGVTTAKIATDAITSDKIANLNVTDAKLASTLNLTSKTITFAGSSIPPSALSQPLTSGTAVTASGSTITFGSLPSWIRRIVVLYDNLSTNGTSTVYVRIGTGGTVLSTGYTAYLSYITSNGAADTGSDTTGFYMGGSAASDSRYGSMVISKLNSNIWVASSVGLVTGSPLITTNLAGSISLGGNLDTLTLSCGANTFDSGTVNVMYE